MSDQPIEDLLRDLVHVYQRVGAGHTHVMLEGVKNSDRLPFVIVPSYAIGRMLNLPTKGIRMTALDEIKTKLYGASGPIAWEATALQQVFRRSLSRITELQADLADAQAQIKTLKEDKK